MPLPNGLYREEPSRPIQGPVPAEPGQQLLARVFRVRGCCPDFLAQAETDVERRLFTWKAVSAGSQDTYLRPKVAGGQGPSTRFRILCGLCLLSLWQHSYQPRRVQPPTARRRWSGSGATGN